MTVNGGATLDLHGNNETIGSLSDNSGSGGTITSGAVGSITLIAGGNNSSTSFAGIIQNGLGTLALTKIGTGTQTLAGANTYTGVTTLSAGTVLLGVAENVGVSGPLGNSIASNAGSIVLGGGTLQYSAANQFDYSGRFSTAAGQVYNVNTNGQSVTWATALTSSGGTLTKSGAGSLTLTGASTYSGTTTVNGGTLLLNYSINPTVLSSSSNLTLGGGILNIQGNSTGTTSQTLGAFALTANTSSGIVVNTNSGGGTTLNLGTWTQNTGSTLFVDLSSSSGAALTSSASGLSSSVFTPWLTVKDPTGFGFGILSGSNIVRYVSGNLLPASGASSSLDYTLSGSGTSSQTVTASQTGNSLVISPNATGQSLTINSGQILGFTTGAVSVDGSTYPYTISGPGQFGASAAALTLTANGANALTVAAPISSGAGSLVVSGTGTVILTGTSAYTGTTDYQYGYDTADRLSGLSGLGRLRGEHRQRRYAAVHIECRPNVFGDH